MKFKPGQRVRFENKKNTTDPRNGEECVVQSLETATYGATIPVEFHDGVIGLAFEHELTPVFSVEAWIQITFEKDHKINSRTITADELIKDHDLEDAIFEVKELSSTIRNIGRMKDFHITIADGTEIGVNPSQITCASFIGGDKLLAELEGMKDESA